MYFYSHFAAWCDKLSNVVLMDLMSYFVHLNRNKRTKPLAAAQIQEQLKLNKSGQSIFMNKTYWKLLFFYFYGISTIFKRPSALQVISFLIMPNISRLKFSAGSMLVAKNHTLSSDSTNPTNQPLLFPLRSDQPVLALNLYSSVSSRTINRFINKHFSEGHKPILNHLPLQSREDFEIHALLFYPNTQKPDCGAGP